MERLVLLPIFIIAALVSVRLELSYVGLAIIVGVALPVISIARGSDTLTTSDAGFIFVAIGLGCLLLAYLVSRHFGISFETLDHDHGFPRLIRRLPYYGLAFLTSGIVSLVLSLFRRR